MGIGSTPGIGGLASADCVLGALTPRPRVGACGESMSSELTASALELHASLAVHSVLDLPLGLAARVAPGRVRLVPAPARHRRGLAREHPRPCGPDHRRRGAARRDPALTPSVTGFVRTDLVPGEGPAREPAVSASFTAGAGVALHTVA